MTKDVIYLKCPSCGESNYKQLNETTCECNIYGCKTKFFIVDSDISSELNEALHARERYNFKQADEIYINILSKTQDEKVKVSCYFGRLLSYFGVVYIKDFNKNTVITFSNYDPEYESIKQSSYYTQIINSTYSYLYTDKLEELDKEYKRIKKELDKETLYDLFICVKISNRTIDNPFLEGYTVDSNYARDIYDELTKKGLKVFYSEKALSGIDYDAQIYSALMRSKSILVITSKKEYLESSWVQSEWRRWLNFIKEDLKEKNSFYLFIPNNVHIELPNNFRKIQRYTDTLKLVTKIEEDLKHKDVEKEVLNIDKQLINAENKILFREFDEAEKIYKEVSQIAPNDYRPWLGLVDILIESGTNILDTRYIRYINRAIQLCKDDQIVQEIETKYHKYIIAPEEARKKAEAEARRKAEEEAKKKAEEEARRKAEAEARKKPKERIKSTIFSKNGVKYLTFGKYPQNLETDSNIISALNKISKKNSLGYIEYNGNEYKKVTATPDESTYTFINGQTIVRGKTYYFKVEPIKWRILDLNDGTYKLLSDMILDNTDFYHTYNETRTINGTKIYPNNYEYSNIRAWLNGYDGTSYNVDNYTNKGFIDIAFTDEEKSLINETLVDNSLSSTGYSENPYICNNTTDKIYLLSVSEATNTNYGFTSTNLSSTTRQAIVSDYARSKGCYINTTSYYGNGDWWFRSPDYSNGIYARVVNDGGSFYGYNVTNSDTAVRAALKITI